MPVLIVRCSRCGIEFSPEPSDFLRGLWRVCANCRSTPPSATADTLPDVRLLVTSTYATETQP